MLTFVAFAGMSSSSTSASVSVLARTARVEAHYASLHGTPPTVRSALHGGAGVISWPTSSVETTWPTFAQRGERAVVAPYPPLGVERLVGDSVASAPFELVDALRAAPTRVLDLTPPFAAAAVQSGDLDLFTDALGIGRLFEVRTAWGWVWSNRPVAAALFADIPLRPDPQGWAQSAVMDEFYGSVTPLAGVRVIGPATHLHWDARAARLTSSSLDVTSSLVTPGAEARLDDLVDEAAADLVVATASISRWYPGTPVVDLSGGRDSRLVAAGFIAGGTEVTLHSHDAVPGDLLVAQDLVSRLPGDIPHTITHMSTGTHAPPRPFEALHSARAWHAYAEGLRPCTYLHYTAPATLDRAGSVVVGGAGGEAAHGYYYARADGADERSLEAELVADLADPAGSRRAIEDAARRIVQRHCPQPSVTGEARTAMVETITAELARIRSAGVVGPTILDHFYVGERMRRWGSTAERQGIASPLFTPSFQRAALALRPHQRRSNVLHRLLTERLVPQWTGVPYFPGEMPSSSNGSSSVRATPPRVIRLAACPDAAEAEAVLATPDTWAYPFDAAVLADYWRRSQAGESTAVQERMLRSAVWRAGFEDHLADIAGRPRPDRAGRTLPDPAPVPVAAPAQAAPSSQVRTSPEPKAMPTPTHAPSTHVTVLAALRQADAVRRIGQSSAWSRLRVTPAGRYVRKVVAGQQKP